MGLVEDVQSKKAEGDRLKRCKLGIYMTDLMDPSELEALEYAIAEVRANRWTLAFLVGLLNSNDYIIGKTVVSDHVRKVCACDHR